MMAEATSLKDIGWIPLSNYFRRAYIQAYKADENLWMVTAECYIGGQRIPRLHLADFECEECATTFGEYLVKGKSSNAKCSKHWRARLERLLLVHAATSVLCSLMEITWDTMQSLNADSREGIRRIAEEILFGDLNWLMAMQVWTRVRVIALSQGMSFDDAISLWKSEIERLRTA